MTARWDTAASVLCVRLDSLGDVLMTGPAIRAAKRSMPGRRVTLLTSPAGADAAALLPDVDRVIVYDAPWMKATEPRPSSAPDLRMIERLRRERFDASVIFTVYSQNPLPAAMLCYLADVPLRLAHCRENPYQLLTDWMPEIEPQQTVRHEVRRQLDLVAAAGWHTADEWLAVRITDSDRRVVDCLLDRLGLGADRRWVVVHPGASAPSRRYPPELFAQACGGLAADHGLRIVFTGGDGERSLIDGVRMRMTAPSSSLAGQLTLGQLAALLERAPLLIANNTGPVHLAAAVGTSVVDLYALTNPQHTPWGVPNRVLSYDVPCRNCYKSVCPEGHGNCLGLIPPEAVMSAAIDLLAETAMPEPRKEVAV